MRVKVASKVEGLLMRVYERAVFPGRFQPPHLGHLYALRWSLNLAEEIVVVVGSAEKSHTLTNPMTAGERILALRESIKEEGLPLERFIIIPVPDIQYNSLWVSYLETLIPRFHCAISGNPLVKRLFSEKGYPVHEPPFYMREQMSGIRIRKMMIEGGKWDDLVPRAVARIIREAGIIERMKQLLSTDEPPTSKIF